MKIAVTGHRPNKLWGYDYNHPKYIKLGWALRNILIKQNATHIISGMALGVDTIFALVGLKLKLSRPLTIECAIPCKNHSSKWTQSSIDKYNDILQRADIVTYVTDGDYTSTCMQERNEYMVNNCDLLIAVWDGTSGGTGNCVNYAKSIDRDIIYINPNDL